MIFQSWEILNSKFANFRHRFSRRGYLGNAIICRLHQLQPRFWLLNFPTESNTAGCLTNGGNNKTTPLGECLPPAVDRPVIASNALSGNARVRDMCTHMPFLLGAQAAGGRRDRPEINRNCNGPVTQYHLFGTIQWIGLMRCGSATNGGGYRNSRAALTYIYTHKPILPLFLFK